MRSEPITHGLDWNSLRASRGGLRPEIRIGIRACADVSETPPREDWPWKGGVDDVDDVARAFTSTPNPMMDVTLEYGALHITTASA
jgi:hypothetical protein